MIANRIRLESSNDSIQRWIISSAILVIFISCMLFLGIDLLSFIYAIPQFFAFFTTKFLPPSFKNIEMYISPVMDTVYFAIIGTYISTIFAFIFGLFMSEKTNPNAWLRNFVRGIMSFFRNIPILIWASLMVYIFGVGSLVGLCALFIATIGFLSRSYADSLNGIAMEKLEAIQASGANYFQYIWHGIIPNFLSSWIHWTLYAFEINIRASMILGMVGAGGIGVLIQTNIKLFKYHEAFAIIIIIVMIVLLTELMTNTIRKMIK